ncbi:MAG: alcohol dehydrogenase catalytic domain-containing protein, partial [Planctomycetota bacterium]
MKTRAAILVEQKKPLVIEEVEVPPLKLGQVLVKVLASGICGSQIGEINGVKGPDRFLPHLLGHEGCVRRRCIFGRVHPHVEVKVVDSAGQV